MSEPHYKHCTYKLGTLTETAWLPEKLAVVGKKIYFGIKTRVESKQPLWEIVSVSDLRLPESYLKEHERDYKTQREASDI